MTVLESNFLVPNATFVVTALVALLLVVALIVVVVTVLARRRTDIATETTTRAEQKPAAKDPPRRFIGFAHDAQGSGWGGRVLPLQVVDRVTGEPRPRPQAVPHRT